MSEKLVNITVDGQSLQAPQGAMLIEVTDQTGIRVPRFCYHHKLSVAANCRMCLVDVEKAPKPLPACATPVMDGMVVHTRSPRALSAQKSVMEFLLINHPLDCPICDQGGECELQDVAMGYGGDVSQFTERKRVVKDKNLGPLIATDMTRCIHCTRCVRFGQEVAGIMELGATGRGENMEIGTFVEKSVDSEMSGNVIDLCPVGALTSKPFRFSARAWEMTQRDALAPHDSVGSNVHVHIARGRVMRVVPRENETINECWISDRDRFSYEGLYSDDRLAGPMIKQDGKWSACDWETALTFAADGLRKVRDEQGGARIGALGSAHATLEELYLLQKLARGLGSDNVDHRLNQVDFSDQATAPAYPTLGQPLASLEAVDAALLVGSNARKEHPIVNHRLRKASLSGARISVLSPIDYEVNYPLANNEIVSPSGMVDALAGVAAALIKKAKVEPDAQITRLLAGVTPSDVHKAIAEDLVAADSAVVLLGNIAMASPRLAVIRALAANIASLAGVGLGYLPSAANTVGAWQAGVLPHRGSAGQTIDNPGLDASAMLDEGLDAYVLLGVEPELDSWHSAKARSALRKADFVVSLTAFQSEEMQQYADVLLPLAVYAETSGSYVNAEGNWQSATGAVAPAGDARPGWKVLRVLGNLCDVDGFDYQESSEVRDELAGQVESMAAPDNLASWQAPDSLIGETDGLTRLGITPLYSLDPIVRRAGSLQETADAGDAAVRIHASLAEKLGLSEGDSVTVVQGEVESSLSVALDPRVHEDCVLLAAGVAGSAGLGGNFAPVELRKGG